MPSAYLLATLGLLLTAAIWGFAFVAQRLGMDHLGPCAFNAVRSFIGCAALIPAIALLDRLDKQRPSLWGKARSAVARRNLLVGGALCGTALGIATIFQQMGMLTASVGKAGFLTALYIILVPIFGHFLGQKSRLLVWISAGIALIGMALLCNLSLSGGFHKGEYWLLACSAVFAVQILLVARYALVTDCVRLSCVQFFASGVVSLLCMPLNHEMIGFDAIWACKWPLLYCGVLSSGVAYTLQNVGQKYVHPAVATVLMSLEAVFSVLGGWLLLHQSLTPKELAGCGVLFAAVLLAQAKR